MRMRRVIALGTGIALALAVDGSAQAGFTDGSFETGSFAGWVTQDVAAPFYALVVATFGSDNTFGWPWSSTPTDGTWTAFHGFDGDPTGGSMIRIAQDVLIDGPVLMFDYRGAWDMTFGATLSRTFTVNIEVAGGGGNLQSDLILTAAPNTTVFDTGPLTGMVDVSAHVGNFVRVSFDWLIPEIFTGPGQFQLDNVRLVPTPGALVLLGLAGLLSRGRRRRRT